MPRSPETMFVSLSLKKPETASAEDKVLITLDGRDGFFEHSSGLIWNVLDPQKLDEYIEANLQGIMIMARDPGCYDYVRQLLEESGFDHKQELTGREDEAYIEVLHIIAFYIGSDSYRDSLNSMLNLTKEIINSCEVRIPGF